MMRYIVAVFDTPEKLFTASRTLRDAGHTDLDSHTPYPLEAADEALGLKKSWVPLIVLVGGLGGALLGYTMQWYLNAVDFPINVGGRPAHSAPSFVPITFEVGVLLGSLS